MRVAGLEGACERRGSGVEVSGVCDSREGFAVTLNLETRLMKRVFIN